MHTSQELWNGYHTAVQNGEMEKAKEILQQILKFKSSPAPRGGCAKCRKRFY
jgi:hypothetical protein